MELTGKCKEEFKKWYVTIFLKHSERYYESKDYTTSKFVKEDLLRFYHYPNSMKYGVLVDYFDSVDINLTVSYDSMISAFNWWVDSEKKYSGKERSRPEARIKAIEKANELRNQQLNK